MKRKLTRQVNVGSMVMGGGNPVSVQTMWDTPINKVDTNLIGQINSMQSMGCNLIRFAAPDLKSVEILGEIAERISMPLVADIHFDYKIALRCMDFPIAKIRINPGNIGASWKVKEIIEKALSTGTTIRVGVNGGSMPANLKKESDLGTAMVKAALAQLEPFESAGFKNVVVSLKSSDININYRANKLFSAQTDYPLHLGITEAGPIIPSLVKSTLGLSRLLEEGIGDTIRISISDDPVKEVMAGVELLSALGQRRSRVNLISCPKCARATFDTHKFTSKVQNYLYTVDKNINVAIMGCVVNGPGEAAHADIGITGVGNKVVIFQKDKILRKITADEAYDAFIEEVEKL